MWFVFRGTIGTILPSFFGDLSIISYLGVFFDVPEPGSLSQEYIFGVCFRVCFAPLSSSRKTKMRGVFRRCVWGYVSPKSNFQPYLSRERKKIQTHLIFLTLRNSEILFADCSLDLFGCGTVWTICLGTWSLKSYLANYSDKKCRATPICKRAHRCS